jgi:hydrogenase 3 maturation protease
MPSKDGLVSDIRNRVRGKVAIVGMGNILRGDDGLGPKLIELLRGEKINASLFDCGTAPENYAIPILSTSSETIIFIDAADIDLPPGEVRLMNTEEISKVSFSTHSPSPRLFIDLLKTGKDDLNIFFISVQPKTTILGERLSQEVYSGLELLKKALVEALA